MRSRLSTILYSEHATILDAANLALSLDNLWEENPEMYKAQLSLFLEFFSCYADRYHHSKEEEIIFRSLLKTNEKSVATVVNELCEHHEQFRDSVEELKVELENHRFVSAQEKLRDYTENLLEHFKAEEEGLIPMMDDLFTEDEVASLYSNCLDIDENLGLKQKQEMEEFILVAKLNSDLNIQRKSKVQNEKITL
jgi:hemerythrin-like domain-containing protein